MVGGVELNLDYVIVTGAMHWKLPDCAVFYQLYKLAMYPEESWLLCYIFLARTTVIY